MTTADTEAMTALHELLDERQRYEGWMRTLEDKRATTPAHVYNRVHTDYTLRLDRVLHRLSERTEQLRSTVDAMTSRLNALRSREADQIDARQEAELRATVGEYTETEWSRIRSEADREIEAIAIERQSVEKELEEMQRIMDLTRAPSQGEQGSVVSPSIVPASVATPTAEPTTDRASPGESPPSIEKFVAHWPVPHVASTGVEEASHRVSQRDGVLHVPQMAVPDSPASIEASSGGVKPPQSETAPQPEADPRRDQEKSLKCPECGALNYATEWYCERCGGELATF